MDIATETDLSPETVNDWIHVDMARSPGKRSSLAANRADIMNSAANIAIVGHTMRAAYPRLLLGASVWCKKFMMRGIIQR